MHHRLFLTAAMAASLVTAMLACSDEPSTVPSGSSGNTSSSSAQASSGNAAVSSTGASSSTGMPFECDPPAEPGSLFELNDVPLYVPTELSMCQYRGDVMLIFNAAAI